MPEDWVTGLRRPVSLRGLKVSSERVLGDLLGVPPEEVDIVIHEDVPGPADAWANRPVDSDTINRELNPSLDLGNDPQVEAFFDWSARHARTAVAIWCGPEPAIVVSPYRTDPSYVLAMATIIAAARDFGDGIGDAHVLLGDRLPETVPSPADQDEVLLYLREPPGRYATIDEAIAAVLAKTYLVRPMPRPSTAKR
jgi:hypothetical protein